MKKNIRHKIRIFLNIFIAAAVLAAWLASMRGEDGVLTAGGLRSLRYFTTLSNLFAGAAALVWLAAAAVGRSTARWLVRLKYAACCAVLLTFAVVMLFLGPLYGYRFLLTGPSLWLHMLVPLVAAAELVLLSEEPLTRRDNAFAVLPPIVYGSAYTANLLINGVGEYPRTNDWYGFVRWGFPVGIAIFAGICLAAYLLGMLVRVLNGRLRSAPRR
ncbi:MAG: hypothetical protein IJU78_02550 [Clostridia bacterium]|nr:hypothetical protein [Clostridia bacterium]